MENIVRWYKGIYKIIKLSGRCKMGKALYMSIESNDMFREGERFVCPCRLCWRNPKLNRQAFEMKCLYCGDYLDDEDEYINHQCVI